MKASRAFFALGLVLLVSACARPTFVVARDEGSDPKGEFKYTRKQAAIAAERAVLTLAAVYDKEKGTWALKPGIVKVEEMKKLLADRAKSLDLMQRYDNEWFVDFIDWVKGMRPALEREEQATLWLLQRIQFVQTFNEFTELVGELPKEVIDKDAEYFFEHGSKNYSVRMIYPARDVTKIPFTARYIEEAKKQGKLKQVDSFMVTDSRQYGEKVKDLQDPNKFTWDKRQRGWVILSYKIITNSDAPGDNVVHYIEGYRMDASSLVREDLPALRGFLATGGNNVSVFVLDYDRKDENGYASPDAVKKIFQDIVTGRDLYDNESLRKDLLVALYERPENDKTLPERRRPPDKPVYVEIVPIGKKINVEIWEKKDAGWKVPFDHLSLTANLDVAYTAPKGKEDLALLEKNKDLKKIRSFVRRFKRASDTVVVEYWQPKEEYSKFNITYVAAGFGVNGIYTVQRKGMTREEAEIEFFASHVKVIDYFYGGTWFRIVDEAGDGVFEKRRQIADPTKSVDNSSAAASSYHDMSGN